MQLQRNSMLLFLVQIDSIVFKYSCNKMKLDAYQNPRLCLYFVKQLDILSIFTMHSIYQKEKVMN